jgi:hypothetical protein
MDGSGFHRQGQDVNKYSTASDGFALRLIGSAEVSPRAGRRGVGTCASSAAGKQARLQPSRDSAGAHSLAKELVFGSSSTDTIPAIRSLTGTLNNLRVCITGNKGPIVRRAAQAV